MTKEELIIKKIELENEISALDNKQNALKILMNSEYGSLASPYFRYYDIRLASAVTLSGQWAIRHIENYLNSHSLQKKYKWEIIYMDTDSAFISIEYVINKIKEKHPDLTISELLDKIDKFVNTIIQPIIEEGFQQLAKYCNSDKNELVMKREKIISKCFWVAKKMYAMLIWDKEGIRYETPQMNVKGLQIIKSTTPKIIRDRLKKSTELILSDQDLLVKYINETKELFFKTPYNEIAFPRGVNHIQKYIDKAYTFKKGTPIHSRGAIVYNRYIEQKGVQHIFPPIREGDKIKFIYLFIPNILGSNVISFHKRLPDEIIKYIDYDKMYYKTYFSVLENFQKVLQDDLKLSYSFDINSLF